MLDAPGDHFMALIKFSSGIERLRHRVVVAFLTIMERIGWRVTTIRTNRGSTRRNKKRAGGYCITTVLLISPFRIRPPFRCQIFPANSKLRSTLHPILVQMIQTIDSKRFYISIARRFLSRTIFHSSRNASTIRGKLLDENCRVSPHIFFDIPV